MSQDIIDPIERISILFKLVQHYFNTSSIEFNIRLALELASTIDYLKIGNKINKNMKSEYYEQLNKILTIVLNYYPKILKDLNKCDINYTNNYLISDRINNYNNINIINCHNSYNEIDYLLNYINNNTNKNIAIICLNEKLINLLTIRLELNNIKYNNNAKYEKNYYKISQLFKNKIEYYFDDINKTDLIKITKLLSFLDSNNNIESNINICDLDSLHDIKNSDTVFCLSMNNNYWQLRNNTWFNITSTQYNINNIFNYIANNSKELYCMYSSIVDRKNTIKSSILNKLEIKVQVKQYNQSINNIMAIATYENEPSIDNFKNSNNNSTTNNTIMQSENIESINSINRLTLEKDNCELTSKFYNLNNKVQNSLMVLNSKDVNNLLYDSDSFYINNILGLKHDNISDKDSICKLFKDIFYVFFNNNHRKTYFDILKITEELDPLYFQKFQQIINYLENNIISSEKFDYVLNNDLLETNINNNIIIKAHCDRIEINNNNISIKKYSINKIKNKNSVILGKETNLLTQALILKNSKVINEYSEINLEVISPDWQIDSKLPITISKFILPFDNINKHLESILNKLEDYNIHNIHFKL